MSKIDPAIAASVLAAGLESGHDPGAPMAIIPTRSLGLAISELRTAADEIERLRAAIHAAAALLTEGDPAEELRVIASNLKCSAWEGSACIAAAVALDIEEAARILGEACPPRPEGREEGS